MPLYFSREEVDLDKLKEAQPHLVVLNKLQPHQFKSRNLVGLRDALRPVAKIFYTTLVRSDETDDEWKTECKKTRHFLELLDKVFIHKEKEKRLKSSVDESDRLLNIYEGLKNPNKEEQRLLEFFLKLSPPVLLEVICGNNERELLSLGDDLEKYGIECEGLQGPLCKRLKQARKKSEKFREAWDAWEKKEKEEREEHKREEEEREELEREEMETEEGETEEIGVSGNDGQPSWANTREPTSIQSNESTTTSPNPSFDGNPLQMPIGFAQIDPTRPPLSQQVNSTTIAICQSIGPPAKRPRRGEFSPGALSQSPQSSCVRDGQPWTNNSTTSPSSASTPQAVSTLSNQEHRAFFISKMIENPVQDFPTYQERIGSESLTCTQYHTDAYGAIIFYTPYSEMITRKEVIFDDLKQICRSVSLIMPKVGLNGYGIQLVFEVEGQLVSGRMDIHAKAYKWLTRDFNSQKFNGLCLIPGN